MSKPILSVVALLLLSCSGEATGNGQSQTQTRTVSAFDQVRNESALDVTVTPGPTSVSVTADSNLLPLITTVVNGDQLVIAQSQNMSSFLPLSAAATTPNLIGIDCEGSGSLTATGFTASDFNLALAGSGAVTFQGTVAMLTLNSSGSGATLLTGSATGLQATVAGSGGVDGSNFPVVGQAHVLLRGSGAANLVIQGDSTLEVDGSGSLTVALDGGTTNFTVSGSGDILWSGQTTVGQVNVTGSGSVTHQ